MGKILCVGDLHLRPSHFEMAQEILEKVRSELKKGEHQHCVILGDIFHFKGTIYATVLELFRGWLNDLSSSGLISEERKMILIVGNHDWAIEHEVHSLESFKTIPGVVVVDEFYLLDKDNAFISYCRNMERLSSLLEKCGKVKRLFGHFDINQFSIGSGYEEQSSYCDPDFFKGYKQIISGHFHLGQEKKIGGTEFIYVGTGYTTDRGESDQEKRLLSLNLTNSEWESIPTNMTYHRTIKIKCGDEFPALPEDEVKRGVKYFIKLEGTKEQIAEVKRPKDYSGVIEPVVTSSNEKRLEIDHTTSQRDILIKFIEHDLKRQFPEADKQPLDKDKLLKIAERILARARS